MTVVSRDVEEDSEEYWDRAWAFAAAISGGGGAPREKAWSDSFKKHYENKGAVY
jgi:hypothetical protein